MACYLVARQVVKDDDVAEAQGRYQLGLDIEVEHFHVLCPIEYPSGIKAVMAQGANECLGAPVPERCVIDQGLPARAQPVVLAMLVLSDVVDKCQSFQMSGHEWLTLTDPDVAQVGYVVAFPLKRL